MEKSKLLGKEYIDSMLDPNSSFIQYGLTKREYFALHLMQGLLSGADRHSQKGDCQNWNYEHLSKISIQASDALLVELSNEKGQ